MRKEAIQEVGIDEVNRLMVRASGTIFDRIYRAAMGVEWDAGARVLISPPPKEWDHLRWFAQILAAVAGEYGIQLHLRSDTLWTSVPIASRREIERFARSDWLAQFTAQRQEHDRTSWDQHQLQQALADAAPLWENEQYAAYVEALAPARNLLSPAQSKRLAIAEKRSRT